MSDNKCKNCGGEIIFNPNTQTLSCKYCGSSFTISAKNSASTSNLRRDYHSSLSLQSNTQTSKTYSCSNCGTKSVINIDQSMTRCASCGNISLKEIHSQTTHPDGLIPFSVSRPQAEQIFKTWIKSRKFAPNDLILMAKRGKLTGLYTPVYNFDYTEHISYSAIGIKTTKNADGYERKSRHPVFKEKTNEVNDNTISGNSRIGDGFITGLGDYDFAKLKPFSTSYLLGFAGIDTNIDVHTACSNMVTEVRNRNRMKAKSNLNFEYDDIENFNCTTNISNITLNYAYLPIWANHYTYNGKEYHCYINGQTGKATGKAPKSFAKIFGLIAGILAGVAVGTGLFISLILKLF